MFSLSNNFEELSNVLSSTPNFYKDIFYHCANHPNYKIYFEYNNGIIEEASNIYTSWKSQNQDCETVIASGNAGALLYNSYLAPVDTAVQASIRSSKARTIYEEIVKNAF